MRPWRVGCCHDLIWIGSSDFELLELSSLDFGIVVGFGSGSFSSRTGGLELMGWGVMTVILQRG